MSKYFWRYFKIKASNWYICAKRVVNYWSYICLYFLQVNGQRLAYKFVKPPFGKPSGSTPQQPPAKTTVTPPTCATPPTEEDKKKVEEPVKETENKAMAVIPTVPCVRSNSVTLPQTTVSGSSMGFRIIPAPLVSPSHMNYPVSIYPYVVPYVIPACSQIGIIKS